MQPASVTVASGAPATFSVSAAGDATLQYQWLRNGVPVPQAVQSSLTVTAAPADDGAIYRVVVKNASSEVRSEAAALRLTGAAQYKVIGAIDDAFLAAQAWPNYFGGVAIGSSGELLVNIKDGAATLQRHSGTGLTPVGRFPACIAAGGMVADRLGNAYLACARAVVRIAADGAATVFAGTVALGGDGNIDGKADAARFSMLNAIAIGADGVLYVGDYFNHNVRRIDVDGNVSTLAGSPANTQVADGVGRAAGFGEIRGLAVDAQGNVYVSDGLAIRRISSGGVVTTIAGSSTEFGERDGAALSARFNYPSGLAFDSAGNLFIADSENRLIRKLGTDGQVTTFAGSKAIPGARDGSGSQAGFAAPMEMAIDAHDQLYVVDQHTSVRRVTPDGVVTTLFAVPTRSSTGGARDGASGDARFLATASLAADMAGNLYVSDLYGGTVRKVSPSGVVSTLARGVEPRREYFGSPIKVSAGVDGGVFAVVPDSGDGVIGIDANGLMTRFAAPKFTDWVENGVPVTTYLTATVDIAADRKGKRYELIVERASVGCGGTTGCPGKYRYTLRRVGADGKTRDWRGGDVPGRSALARDWQPSAITTDASGNLYLSESTAIWKLTPAGEWSLFSNTMPGLAAGLAVDSHGNVYALGGGDGTATIRRITPDGKVTILSGDATTPRLYAALFGRQAIAIDADDRLWVTQGDGIVQIDHP